MQIVRAQQQAVAAPDPRVWSISTNSIATPAHCVTFGTRGTRGTLALGGLLAERYLSE